MYDSKYERVSSIADDPTFKPVHGPVLRAFKPSNLYHGMQCLRKDGSPGGEDSSHGSFTGGDFVIYTHQGTCSACDLFLYLVTRGIRLLGILGHLDETCFPLEMLEKGVWIHYGND